MKNFLTSKKDRIGFVYNFHCYGKQLLIPYNAKMTNDLNLYAPELKGIYGELVNESQIPAGTDVGTSHESTA